MKTALIAAALAAGMATPAAAQTAAQTATPSITLFELPGYLGRSVTVTADTPDLATRGFARRAQSARVTGSWQLCPTERFEGSCRTLTANAPLLVRNTAVSLRPTPTAALASASASASPSTPAATTATTAALDLEALDAGGGTDGQDVSFFARPSLSGSEIAAGTNDMTAATAFCRLAGATSASHAGRARVQSSNLIDLAAKSRVRGFALRDVLCRR